MRQSAKGRQRHGLTAGEVLTGARTGDARLGSLFSRGNLSTAADSIQEVDCRHRFGGLIQRFQPLPNGTFLIQVPLEVECFDILRSVVVVYLPN